MIDYEDLAQLRRDILGGAEAAGVSWLPGILQKSGALPVIDCDDEAPDAPELFVRAMASARARLAVCTETVLDEDTFREAVERLVAEKRPADVIAAARACERHVGQLAGIEIHAIGSDPQVVLSFRAYSSWFEMMFGVGEFEPEEADSGPERYADPEFERRRQEQAAWSNVRRTAAARTAATDERFPLCKNEAARIHLLRLVLGDDLPQDEYLVQQIAREANAIYDLEIRRSK